MKISAVKRLFVGRPLATAQAWLSKTSALLFRRGVVVVDVPFHLR